MAKKKACGARLNGRYIKSREAFGKESFFAQCRDVSGFAALRKMPKPLVSSKSSKSSKPTTNTNT